MKTKFKLSFPRLKLVLIAFQWLVIFLKVEQPNNKNLKHLLDSDCGAVQSSSFRLTQRKLWLLQFSISFLYLFIIQLTIALLRKMATELSVPAADETRKAKKETRKIADTAGGFLVTTSHWPIKQVTPRLYTIFFISCLCHM